MELEIEGTAYLSVSGLLEELDVSRQTLWRWRKEGKIPQGHRFRDGKVVFTGAEADEIRRFANRVEPISEANRDQMPLF